MSDDNSITEDAPVSDPGTGRQPWMSEPGEVSPLTKALQARRPNGPQPAADPHFNPVAPPDHHPDVPGEHGTDLNTYKTAHRGLDKLWQVHTKLNETAISVRDKANLAKQVEPIAARAVRDMREDMAALDRQIRYAEDEIAKELGAGVGAIASETRAVVRAMPESERLAFCREPVAARDVASLKAIAAVSPFLSGLSAEAYGYVRAEAERLVAPEFVDERDVGTKARARMQRALEYFDETMAGNIKRWRSTDDQRIADMVAALKPREAV